MRWKTGIHIYQGTPSGENYLFGWLTHKSLIILSRLFSVTGLGFCLLLLLLLRSPAVASRPPGLIRARSAGACAGDHAVGLAGSAAWWGWGHNSVTATAAAAAASAAAAAADAADAALGGETKSFQS